MRAAEWMRNGGSGGDAVELEAGEAGVEAVLRGQRRMLAFLDDAAAVHDDDAVGGADGGEADDAVRPREVT